MRLKGFDLNLILVLDALLREKNVTRVARKFGRSQSSLSNDLRRLREYFGDPLLVRVGRTLQLSVQGRALVAPTGEAVQQVVRVLRPAAPMAARRWHCNGDPPPC